MEVDYAIAVAEIVLNKCKMNVLVDSAIAELAERTLTCRRWEAKLIGMLTKLLSASTHTLAERISILKGHFEKILREAVHRGYVSLVEGLLNLQESVKGQVVAKVDDDGKTLLHYAAEWPRSERSDAVSKTLYEAYNDSFGLDFVRKLDTRGRSVLHLSSFSGRARFCKILSAHYELQVNAVDYCQQNILHYAAKGDFGERIVDVFVDNLEYLVHGRNKEGETPLHVAIIHGKREMVQHVMDWLHWLPETSAKAALQDTDYVGRTALHLAAREGHLEIVKMLLKAGSNPLEERDNDGKTALHHAVMSNNENALKLVETLLGHYESRGQRALLLWVSAREIGTADEIEGLDFNVRSYLKRLKEETQQVNVLKEAASIKNSSLTWELLNRGADIGKLPAKAEFSWVRKQIEKFSEQGTDLPTLKDTLGRDVIAECIAAHFLNPYIKSPFTVSISGGSGMGKTSVLNLIEAHLLTTAAQLAFPFLWGYENFVGGRNISLSKQGLRMCKKIDGGVAKLAANSNDKRTPQIRKGASLLYLLEKYRPEHKAVYKSLACMDFNQLLDKNEQKWNFQSKDQSLGAVPRILTIRFNSGNYGGKQEAWAGLAVQMTKEIEASMTRAQWLSTCWRNYWRRRDDHSIYSKFILPLFLLTFMAGWIASVVLILLNKGGAKCSRTLKYGSIPITIISIAWVVFNAFLSVFKPVSTRLTRYFNLPDYLEQVGYQQKIISDIEFLIQEIGRRPYPIFSFIADEMWGNHFFREDSIPGTSVPKYSSAPPENLRIIAFVDQVDQRETDAILQMLHVFKIWKINVVLGMDKSSVIKALSDEDEDYVDKFITKAIQLPVKLPDPEDDQWESFLQAELGSEPNLSKFVELAKAEEREIYNPEMRGESANSNFVAGEAENAPGCGIIRQATGEAADYRSHRDVKSGVINQHGRILFSYGRLLKAGQGISDLCETFFSWLHRILHSLYVGDCNVRNQEYYDTTELEFQPLIKRARRLRGTLIQGYSKEEVKTFNRLKAFAVTNETYPREWKRYLNYHRFARNVLCKRARNVTHYPVGWKIEFVAWTFACWQWKHEMNILIKKWDKYVDIKDNGEQNSFKEIVVNYIKQQWNCPTQISSLTEEESRERMRWYKLYEALYTIKDVSMEGIECFQQFRFHCDGKNLKCKLRHSLQLQSKMEESIYGLA